MRRLFAIGVCSAVFSASVAPVMAKPACYTPTEVSTVQLRQLQIEMMVSTLRCDSATYDFRGRYGAFMERINPLMPDNAKRLKAIVSQKVKGGFDQYLTAMSNDVQNISQQDPLYCPSAVRIIEQVASHDTKDVPGIAAEAIPAPFQVSACAEKPEPKPKSKNKMASK